MSHKAFNGLQFTNSVPKFLQTAVAKHGLQNKSFIDKKFVAESTEKDETDQVTVNNDTQRFVDCARICFYNLINYE